MFSIFFLEKLGCVDRYCSKGIFRCVIVRSVELNKDVQCTYRTFTGGANIANTRVTAARLCDAGLSHFQCEDGGGTFLKFVIPRSPRSNTNGNGGSVGFVGLRSTFESLFCMQKHNQPPHCSYYHQQSSTLSPEHMMSPRE